LMKRLLETIKVDPKMRSAWIGEI